MQRAVWTQPQPFEELEHTADAGIRVHGDSAAEVLARLILGHAQFLCGGGPLHRAGRTRVDVAPAPDLALIAVDVLRELHARFDTHGWIAESVHVHALSEQQGAAVSVDYAHFEPELHGEGTDIKAITYHAAELERENGGWVGQIIFDI